MDSNEGGRFLAAIEVFDQQEGREIDLARLNCFAARALEAVRLVPAPAAGKGTLRDLERIEVTIVTDDVISSVHDEFMDISGATDVITFDHGEIVISADTAVAQSVEHGTEYDREIALYIVHGLLHLRGYEDGTPDDAATMQAVQEKILAEIWE